MSEPAVVTGYMTHMEFGDQPSQTVILYESGRQVGTLVFTDAALFNATIDMLRNEGPTILWHEDLKRLSIGLEPAGEEEN
jgi:hypothetical protein